MQLVLYQKSPAECFKPIAAFEVMPFRDAGNGVFDHALSVQVSSVTTIECGVTDNLRIVCTGLVKLAMSGCLTLMTSMQRNTDTTRCLRESNPHSLLGVVN